MTAGDSHTTNLIPWPSNILARYKDVPESEYQRLLAERVKQTPSSSRRPHDVTTDGRPVFPPGFQSVMKQPAKVGNSKYVRHK